MTTVTTYSSADASAPVLSGVNGSLVALLDAILVNGYGSKPAAGWTIAYTATNKRIYQSGNNTACPSVVMVTDDGTAASGGTAKTCGAIGATAASALAYANLTNPFPTSGQQANGIFGLKSSTADATARDWIAFADDRTFYLFVSTAASQANGWSCVYQGEMFSYKAASGVADVNRLILAGASYVNTLVGTELPLVTGSSLGNKPNIPAYMPKSYSGAGSAVAVGKSVDASKSNLTLTAGPLVAGNSALPVSTTAYPHPVDTSLILSPVFVFESAGITRGHLRGIWAPMHVQPINHGDTFTGQGQLSGKTFIAINATGCNNNTNYIGQIMVEISSTWDTN